MSLSMGLYPIQYAVPLWPRNGGACVTTSMDGERMLFAAHRPVAEENTLRSRHPLF
jgi:hypothetical protein